MKSFTRAVVICTISSAMAAGDCIDSCSDSPLFSDALIDSDAGHSPDEVVIHCAETLIQWGLLSCDVVASGEHAAKIIHHALQPIVSVRIYPVTHGYAAIGSSAELSCVYHAVDQRVLSVSNSLIWPTRTLSFGPEPDPITDFCGWSDDQVNAFYEKTITFNISAGEVSEAFRHMSLCQEKNGP